MKLTTTIQVSADGVMQGPVVVGQGTRLFPENGLDMALDLVDSHVYPKGITLLVYRPGGRPDYATDVPSPDHAQTR